MLCNVYKLQTGYGILPNVTQCTSGEHWRQSGFTKKVFVAKSVIQKGDLISLDKIIERKENKNYKFEVSEFQT